MTHTSTEQAEALRLASALRGYKSMFIESVAADFEASAKLLEVFHVQRVPLSEAQIEQAMGLCDVCEGDHVLGAFSAGVRHIEKLYGITQEMQG